MYTNIFPVVTYKEAPDPEGTPFPIKTEEVIRVEIIGREGNNVDFLGTYPTEAQAKRVMDDITARIEEQINYMANPRSLRNDGYWFSIFRMPEAKNIITREEIISHDSYMEFVAILQAEGDDDIPSEDEWRAELIAELESEA